MLVMVQVTTSPICGVIAPPTAVGSAVPVLVAALVQLIVALYCVRLVVPAAASEKA